MNTQDLTFLTDNWNKQTNQLEGVLQESIKTAQDHAYALGLERGVSNYHKMIEALENASCALLDAGNKAASEELDKVINEVS